MHRRSALALSGIALVACNALAGLDGDFGVDQASNNPSPGGGSSGTSGSSTSGETSSGSTSSSSGTTTSSGGTTSSSGGTDAGDAGKACGGALFCDDFGGASAAPTWGWTARDKRPDDATTILAVEGTVGQAARHLHVVVAPGPEEDAPGVALFQDLSLAELGDGKTLKLEFDFTLGGGAMYAMLGGFQIGKEGARREYGIALNGDDGSQCKTDGAQLCMSENDRADKPAEGVTSIQKNKSRHANVTLVRAGSTIGGTVSVGTANPEVIHTRADNATPDGVFGPIRVVLGGAFAGDNGSALDLTFDNVVVTVTP